MNSLDIFILIPIAAGFIFGLFRGLVKEVASLAAIILGIYGAKQFSPLAADWLMNSFNISAKVAVPLAYLLLFVAFAAALLILAHWVDKLFSAMALGGLNKLFGGLFGALKFALIVSVLLNVFEAFDSRFSFFDKEAKEKSIGYKPVIKLAPLLWHETLKYDVNEKTAAETPKRSV
ncbi:MAG: CvpA family protein [Prevotellaceae bacterium]|jgi:membrane protein required for colicin V production|nr:CvpA family protein [Prevotellaceae bacterium]